MRCPHGHQYTPENTQIQSDGSRKCRTCIAKRSRAWRGSERICENPTCAIHFRPKESNGRYCSKSCAATVNNQRRGNAIEGRTPMVRKKPKRPKKRSALRAKGVKKVKNTTVVRGS